MNILDKIVAHKKEEVALRKEKYPVKLLEDSIYFETPTVSLSEYLKRPDKHGIIAEFKRRSPSKGDINPYASVEEVSIGYMQAGASALSVLTDEQFFGGKNADLTEARKFKIRIGKSGCTVLSTCGRAMDFIAGNTSPISGSFG